jgi:hypothetical protein
MPELAICDKLASADVLESASAEFDTGMSAAVVDAPLSCCCSLLEITDATCKVCSVFVVTPPLRLLVGSKTGFISSLPARRSSLSFSIVEAST